MIAPLQGEPYSSWAGFDKGFFGPSAKIEACTKLSIADGDGCIIVFV